jgi:hypothetical protein
MKKIILASIFNIVTVGVVHADSTLDINTALKTDIIGFYQNLNLEDNTKKTRIGVFGKIWKNMYIGYVNTVDDIEVGPRKVKETSRSLVGKYQYKYHDTNIVFNVAYAEQTSKRTNGANVITFPTIKGGLYGFEISHDFTILKSDAVMLKPFLKYTTGKFFNSTFNQTDTTTSAGFTIFKLLGESKIYAEYEYVKRDVLVDSTNSPEYFFKLHNTSFGYILPVTNAVNLDMKYTYIKSNIEKVKRESKSSGHGLYVGAAYNF